MNFPNILNEMGHTDLEGLEVRYFKRKEKIIWNDQVENETLSHRVKKMRNILY
jgi:hypothetical protein